MHVHPCVSSRAGAEPCEVGDVLPGSGGEKLCKYVEGVPFLVCGASTGPEPLDVSTYVCDISVCVHDVCVCAHTFLVGLSA